MVLLKASCSAIVCVALWTLHAKLVSSSPLGLNLPLPSSISNTSTSSLQIFNLTSILPSPSNPAPPLSNFFHPGKSWPRIPFTVFDDRHLSSDPPWLEFYWGGSLFPEPLRTTMEWKLGALISKFESLNGTEPCPPYSSVSGGTSLLLSLNSFLPTVTQCIMVLTLFDKMVQGLGVKEVSFYWGFGREPRELRTYSGTVHMWLGYPGLTLDRTSTS